MIPIVTVHAGISVVRDDLFPGGTKARFLPALFERHDEVVYASPAEGGAQTALAQVAKDLGKKATIFVAKRAEPHPRAVMAKALGADVYQVSPGYLTVVQARARAYVNAKRGQAWVRLAPFGMDTPEAIDAIAQAALATNLKPHEVWSAGGSGVLARGLAKAWPNADRHVVQVGRELIPRDVAGAVVHVSPYKFGTACRVATPFPSDPHYDAKAWSILLANVVDPHRNAAGDYGGPRTVVFWNVTGPAAVTAAV